MSENYTSQIACRYYRLGICREAERCKYSHTIENSVMLPSSTLEQQILGQTESEENKSIEESKHGDDDDVNESAAGCHCPCLVDSTIDVDTWVKAAEFVPGQLWQSVVDSRTIDPLNSCEYAVGGYCEEEPAYFASGGDDSEYQLSSVTGTFPHGATVGMSDVCDMCGHLLPPLADDHLRQQHIQECIKQHEEEMELSFAIQRSCEKVCGICMEVVWEKDPEKEARFGVLPNCCHVFCLSCIRRWRAAQQFDKKTVKSCPECRVVSNFVVPSRYWLEDEESKKRLIVSYQSELSKKHCKHFSRGKGKCPFNEKCFYLHAYPDGRVASPRPVQRRQHRAVEVEYSDDDDDDDDDDVLIVEQVSLYDIVEMLNERVALLADRLEHSLGPLLHRHTLSPSDDDD